MSTRHPWTSFYWEDWDAATAHLNHVQYSIYHRLLKHYYRTQKPLVANASDLARVCLAIGTAEEAELQEVLRQFFTLQADGYHNSRADKEIARAVSVSKLRQEVGKRGGLAKARNLVEQKPTHPHPQPHISSEGCAIDGQVHEVASLHPKIQDPFHLSHEVSFAIAEAIVRDGRDTVWAGTKSLADAVAKWPVSEKQFIPSPPRFFRESQYLKDPREWERSNGNGTKRQASPVETRVSGNREVLTDVARAITAQRVGSDGNELEDSARAPLKRGVRAGAV